jgi:predicted nucleic acid-binding protein
LRLTRVLLDANVLVDAQLRDIFLRLAEMGLIEVFWSPKILEELRAVLVEKRGLDGSKVDRLLRALDQAFPSASASNVDPSTAPLLPDPNDRHVLAAATQTECDLLVTFNLRDFPEHATSPFDLIAIDPDGALVWLLQWFPEQAATVIDEQIHALSQPLVSREAFLQRLASRAPSASIAFGAALGIEAYERMLIDVSDASRVHGPQGTIRRILEALAERRIDLLGSLIDRTLAMRLTNSDSPRPLDVFEALHRLLGEVLHEEGWGFSSAKRLTSANTELVKLLRVEAGPQIAFTPQRAYGHLFELRFLEDRWLVIDINGPDPAESEFPGGDHLS